MQIINYLIFWIASILAKAESRNDEKAERFYFLRKQKVAKTFARIRTSCGLFFIYHDSAKADSRNDGVISHTNLIPDFRVFGIQNDDI